MAEWKEYELNQICSRLSSGKGLPAKKISDNGKYPVYGGNGLRGYTETANFEGDCAIIGRQGAYCGNVRYFSGTAYMTEHAVVTCANEDNNTRYLSYLLSTMNLGRLSGQSAQPGLSVKTLGKQIVKVPPLATQNKVVSILAALDTKIEDNEKINKNLLEQALAIYKEWFYDYALSDGVRPENWKITTIDAISSLVTRGIAPKYDDGSDQIVLNQKCIRDHTIDLSLARRHLPKKINEKWISKGDLLINSTGTGTLGRVAQVWFEANNMTVDSHVTIVRPKDPILQSYIGFWGLSHESEIEAQHTGSTGQTELPRDRVKAMELPLPDEDTLSKFNELVIPMTSTVISNQEENASLSQLRDALLPKLMSGELDVSDIDL